MPKNVNASKLPLKASAAPSVAPAEASSTSSLSPSVPKQQTKIKPNASSPVSQPQNIPNSVSKQIDVKSENEQKIKSEKCEESTENQNVSIKAVTANQIDEKVKEIIDCKPVAATVSKQKVISSNLSLCCSLPLFIVFCFYLGIKCS